MIEVKAKLGRVGCHPEVLRRISRAGNWRSFGVPQDDIGRRRALSDACRGAHRAFTLIELLLVLVILGVLAAIVVPKLAGRSEDAKIKATAAEISIIEGALDQFEIDTSRYPSTEEGLRALVENPGNVEGWRGPYVKKGVPTDQWNRPYNYVYPGSNNPSGFDLYSLGPDGREGADDINNWQN